MKLLPFVNKPLEEIEIIGNENTGLLYLVKRHGVTPNENPSDFQEQQKKQQKFLLKLTQRIKQLAREEGVPVHEMRKRVMGAAAPEEKPANEEGATAVEVVDSDEQQMFDYLDEDTAELLFNLQEDKANLAIRAATYMLQYRVVYPVVLASNAVAGSKTLNIESPQSPIDAHTSVRFGLNKFVEIAETLIPTFGAENLSVDEIPFQLKQGDVGFLCQSGTRKLQVGYLDWTEKDTRDTLSEEMIALLFNFYQKEAGIVADIDETDTPEDEGNSLSLSNEQLQMNLSTGETSFTDFNGSGVLTKDSPTKTLVTSQAG